VLFQNISEKQDRESVFTKLHLCIDPMTSGVFKGK